MLLKSCKGTKKMGYTDPIFSLFCAHHPKNAPNYLTFTLLACFTTTLHYRSLVRDHFDVVIPHTVSISEAVCFESENPTLGGGEGDCLPDGIIDDV